MVLYGVVPECHRSVSGMVSECIMSDKMVSLSASGTVYAFSISTETFKPVDIRHCNHLNKASYLYSITDATTI